MMSQRHSLHGVLEGSALCVHRQMLSEACCAGSQARKKAGDHFGRSLSTDDITANHSQASLDAYNVLASLGQNHQTGENQFLILHPVFIRSFPSIRFDPQLGVTLVTARNTILYPLWASPSFRLPADLCVGQTLKSLLRPPEIAVDWTRGPPWSFMNYSLASPYFRNYTLNSIGRKSACAYCALVHSKRCAEGFADSTSRPSLVFLRDYHLLGL